MKRWIAVGICVLMMLGAIADPVSCDVTCDSCEMEGPVIGNLILDGTSPTLKHVSVLGDVSVAATAVDVEMVNCVVVGELGLPDAITLTSELVHHNAFSSPAPIADTACEYITVDGEYLQIGGEYQVQCP